MSPKLKSVLARAVLAGGVALVASLVARSAPHEQIIKVRLGDRDVSHVEGVVTRLGDDEPTAGFSRDFPGATDRSGNASVWHRFSAPNGTYIVVITLTARTDSHHKIGAGAPSDNETEGSPPIPSETSFHRQVSLAGGEVIVSPD